MKPCPSCGRKLQTAAIRCHYCDHVLTPTAAARVPESHATEQRAPVSAGRGRTVVLIVGVVVLAIACWYFFGYAR